MKIFLNVLYSDFLENNSLNNIDNPKDDKIIIANEANTYNLTNAELT